MTRRAASLCLSLLLSSTSAALRTCTRDDFAFKYTECESESRWKVAVPKSPGACEGGDVPRPEKGKACAFTCGDGSYLDMESQECKQCQGGTYSIGGGLRFEDFPNDKLPEGFEIRTVRTDHMRATESGGTECPKGGGWVIKDGWLSYHPTPCWSILSYSTKLVKKGSLEFVYKVPAGGDTQLYFNVDVQNEQCESYLDRYDNILHKLQGKERKESEPASVAQGWQMEKVRLKKGRNVITWRASNLMTGKSSKDMGELDPVIMYRIDIKGLAYSTSCSACPGGTYSTPGASSCSPCKADSYSGPRSDTCSDCAATQFAEPRSTACKPRPPCAASDFHLARGPCDGAGRRPLVPAWLKPQICRPELPASAKLPPKSDEKCAACNPGMSLSSGTCEFCPAAHFSDGDGACHPCPTNTQPAYGYQYISWDSLPRNMKPRCQVYSEEAAASDCQIEETWLPAGNRIHTAHIRRPGIIMVLELEVGGFQTTHLNGAPPSLRNPISHLTFVFQTKCQSPSCQFFFFVEESGKKDDAEVVAVWNGTVGAENGRVYKHPVTRSERTKFIWAFVRSGIMGQGGADDDGRWADEEASLLSVNLTHTKDGGASSCTACPFVPDQGAAKGCLQCQDGNYMDKESRKCIKCPTNTILNVTTSRIGPESCSKCGMNLFSTDGVICKPGEIVSVSNNRKYSIKKLLEKSYKVEGVKVYGHEGSGYFHSFNFTLDPTASVICYDSYARIQATMQKNDREGDWATRGLVCRSTGVPWASSDNDKDKTAANHTDETVLYVSPIDLGTRLVGISTDQEYDGIRVPKETRGEGGVSGMDMDDVHFFFRSEGGPSVNCPGGVSSIVSLRCSPLQNETRAALPKQCPDGTCDGCVYHILLESPQACPVCAESDMSVIRGECVDGAQTIHFIPQKHCVLSGQRGRSQTKHCVVFSRSVQLLSGAASALAILLACLLMCMLKRNRRLEYKYMKLVEGRVGADGERQLPAAESCALDEDEDDEHEEPDKVIFKRGGKKAAQNWGPIREEEEHFAYSNLLQE